jgi:Zn-finger nucleic acid-binding protein
MQTVDKGGIHIEQCSGCRGVFLDRGELEQIASAEQKFYGSPPPYQGEGGAKYGDSPPGYKAGHRDSPPAYGHRGRKDSPPPFRSGYRDSPPPYGHKRKRGGFLDGLFD